MTVFGRMREWVFGPALDPFNPKTRQHIVLVAFLAWVGLGADGLPMLIPDTLAETVGLSREMGWMFVAALFLRAYSFGAGTYTGIEAVSNNINMLAEPRERDRLRPPARAERTDWPPHA